MFVIKHLVVVSAQRKFHFISFTVKVAYLVEFVDRGLDAVGVILEISAILDFGNGVIIDGAGIFRLTEGVCGLIAANLSRKLKHRF